MSTEEFVDTYVGRKRKMYEAAVESLAIMPVEEKDSYISAFIKDEKTDFRSKPNACARVIQPRSPRFNVAVGVYLKPLEKALFRGIAGVFHGVTVAKGLNAFERGALLAQKWGKFRRPVGIMLDAKRFDQHCSRSMIEWKHMVEERVFPELRRYNRWRVQNRCYGRTPEGSIKYVVDGCTMSGDMDTASGNCLIMCGCTWTVMRDIGLTKYEYINDGDDGVLIVEADQVGRVRKEFQRRFLELGFTMKWDGDTDVLERVEFCQSQPIWDGKHWRMVRRPTNALAKDTVTLKRVDRDTIEDQRNAIGWCGLSLAGDLPVFGAFYRTMATGPCPTPKFETGMDFLARGLTPLSGPITEEARLSFWKAFHITPDTQLDIELYYANLEPHSGDPTPTDVIANEPFLNTLINSYSEF
jgi:hypothetical protein